MGAVAHEEKDNATATTDFNQALVTWLVKRTARRFYMLASPTCCCIMAALLGSNGYPVSPANADAAIAVLNKGILANPKDAEVLIALGDAYRSQLKSTDAYTNYNNALAIDPKSAAANVAEGVLWRFADNYDDSEKQFQAALAIDPNFGLHLSRDKAETDLRWSF